MLLLPRTALPCQACNGSKPGMRSPVQAPVPDVVPCATPVIRRTRIDVLRRLTLTAQHRCADWYNGAVPLGGHVDNPFQITKPIDAAEVSGHGSGKTPGGWVGPNIPKTWPRRQQGGYFGRVSDDRS